MIDVRKSPELQAAILGMRRLRTDLRPELYKAQRQELGDAWLPALQRRTGTNLERRIIMAGARTKVSTDTFSVLAATSRRELSNGLVPSIHWPGAEFGARNRRATYDRTSVRGRVHKVTRTLNRQFRGRMADGQIAFDAASEIGTQLVRLWVVTAVDFIRDAAGAEG